MRFLSSFLPLFLFSLLILLCGRVSAHNWLGGLGRSTFASTHYPWPMKIDPYPHMQIGLNQTFTVDWSAGHGNSLTLYTAEQSTYFLIFHESDQHKIPLTPQELYYIVEDYLRMSPRSANLSRHDPIQWRRNHLLPAVRTPTNLDNYYFLEYADIVEKYFYANASSTSQDPRVIARPNSLLKTCKPMAQSSFICDPDLPASQWFYRDEWLDHDFRVEYYNPKYPWLEAVHRFAISVTETVFSNSHHTASFRIPARKGPGNYFLYWTWAGYFDVIDVNVQPEPTANPYGPPDTTSGTGPIPSQFVRVDHCEFLTIHYTSTPCRILNKATMNISQCLADCEGHPRCETVSVIRVGNAPGTFSVVSPIPTTLWDGTQNVGGVIIGPCGGYTQQERASMGCQQMNPLCDISAAQPGDYLCFGAESFFNPILEATDGWTVVQETEDPNFYSTCYFKRPVKNFRPHPPYPKPSSSWIVGDNCVDCDFWRKVERNLSINEAPNWEGKIIYEKEGRCTPCS